MGLFSCLRGISPSKSPPTRPVIPNEKPSTQPGFGVGDAHQGPIGLLPNASNQLLRHLSTLKLEPAEDGLRPYLEYELWLRQAFARGDTKLDLLANLVPIYDGHEERLLSQISEDRSTNERYLLKLPSSGLPVSGDLAIAPTLQQYQRNFECFTHGVLRGLDWTNVVAAGSSALLPLLPSRTDVNIKSDPSVEDPLETYYQQTASSSDIDLFIYGLDEKAAIQRIVSIEAVVRHNQRLGTECGSTLRTENAITIVSPKWPYRHVQIILRLYKSISEILTGFDVDCACVAYNGQQVYSNPRGVVAIATRTNIIDVSRRSPSYENRLYKYRSHNFDAYWAPLDRSKINLSRCEHRDQNAILNGLSRLIHFEQCLQTRGNVHKRRRLLKTIPETGDAAHSGYTAHEIPYGQRFTASKVRKFVALHSKEPYAFGSINDVLENKQGLSKKDRQGKLNGKVTFIKDHPGRQMIGSFRPLTDDDWAEQAYSLDLS